jgi:hypothetical protein
MSLFEELTALPGPSYPVTSLLGNLLKLVAQDACLTKRNVHSTYLVVSRARDVCQAINTLATTAGDGDSWDDFNTLTRMITSLEAYSILHSFFVMDSRHVGSYWISSHYLGRRLRPRSYRLQILSRKTSNSSMLGRTNERRCGR